MQLWRLHCLFNMLQRHIPIFLLVGCLFFGLNGFSDNPDYKSVFEDQWVKAELFIAQNKNWMIEISEYCKIDFRLAVSMVFPELIRYSALRDKIEITLLKSLYVHKGTEYSNFSVGKFQIKPSCAEAILAELKKLDNTELNKYFSKKYRFLSKKAKRIQILNDLEDTRNEFLFVVAIVRMLDEKYRNIDWSNDSEKIKFYAAAYNSGFNNSKSWIEKHVDLKLFHAKTIKPIECYSYAHISEAFFLEMSKKQNIE